jgi:hypothetical protein
MILKISIFYPVAGWNKVLKTLSAIKSDAMDHQLIYLSSEKGDNVRCTYFLKDNNSEFKPYLTSVFDDFFSKNPIVEDNENACPGEFLWMNYPKFSIQFNIYSNPDFDSPLCRLFFGYFEALSVYLLEMISEEEINHESLLNNNLFITIRLIKIFQPEDIQTILHDTISFTIGEYELTEKSNELTFILGEISNVYAENHTVIQNYFDQPDAGDILFENIITKSKILLESCLLNGMSKKDVFNILFNMLNKHLNITPINGVFILSLISFHIKTLNKIKID